MYERLKGVRKITELDTIARAQVYLEKLANGVNPLTNTEVNENDVINNVRISRCLFYTSGILKQIVDNKGKFKVEMPNRTEFNITPEQLANFEFSEKPIPVSEITKRLNSLVNTLEVKDLRYGAITNWLADIGMLSNIIVNNKTKRIPTDAGKQIGIIVEERVSKQGFTYEAVYYNLNAQHFIVDNIDSIITFNREREANKRLAT